VLPSLDPLSRKFFLTMLYDAAIFSIVSHASERNKVKFAALKSELEAIAGDELGEILNSWDCLSDDQASRLVRYLRSELAPYGMLSTEKARENGQSLSKERAEAKRIIVKLEGSI
jgi:hypothetical protein